MVALRSRGRACQGPAWPSVLHEDSTRRCSSAQGLVDALQPHHAALQALQAVALMVGAQSRISLDRPCTSAALSCKLAVDVERARALGSGQPIHLGQGAGGGRHLRRWAWESNFPARCPSARPSRQRQGQVRAPCRKPEQQQAVTSRLMRRGMPGWPCRWPGRRRDRRWACRSSPRI